MKASALQPLRGHQMQLVDPGSSWAGAARTRVFPAWLFTEGKAGSGRERKRVFQRGRYGAP